MDQPQMPNQAPMGSEKPAVSKWLWITLIIVILIGGGFFAWYYLMGPGKTTTATTTTTTDTTASWTTYSDTSAGLSFKYPKTWTKYAANGSNSPLVLNSPTKDSSGNQLNLDYYFGGTTTTPATTDTAHTAYVANVTPLTITGSTKSYYLVVAGDTADRVMDIFVSDQNYTVGKVTNLVTTFIAPNGVTTSMKAELLPVGAQDNAGAAYTSYTSHTDYADLIKIFKTLTASATTSVTSTADWKTFTSQLGGYSVKYPSTWVYTDHTADDAKTAGYESQAIWYKDQAQKTANIGQQHQVVITSNSTTKTLDQEVSSRRTGIASEDSSVTFKSATTKIGTHSVATIDTTDKNGTNRVSYIFVEKGKIIQISTGSLAEATTIAEVVQEVMGTIVLN